MAALATKTVLQVGRQQTVPALGAVYVSKRDGSTNLASYKRGRGGRSSFSGVVATVFGASGFIGRYVTNRLGRIGCQVVCPYRGDPYPMRDLKLMGDLGQILFLPYHLQDEESIRKAMKYSNVVVNCVGRDWETKNFKFNDVHVDGARRIARIARETGIERLVHISSMNASPKPPKIIVKGGSNILKSKYEGEVAVREEFPDAVIMRPADVYGAEDRFLRFYALRNRQQGGLALPLWKRGTQTVKMPVHVGDVAQGIVEAIFNEESPGKTYECVGPQSYYLSDLVDYFFRVMRYEHMYRIPMNPAFLAKAHLWSYSTYPVLNKEKLDKDHVSDILTGEPTLEELGLKKLVKLEDRAVYELKPFRRHSYYEEAVGEFADPSPPPVIATT